MNRTLCFILRLQILTASVLFVGGCSVGFDGFKTYNVKDDPNFKQDHILMPKERLDIILMLDNSDHMESIHTNLTNNAAAIINQLSTRNIDFQIGVGLSDAFARKYFENGGGYQTRFSQGVGAPSGYPIITSTTPNAATALATNLNVGVAGARDTRALESLEDVLADGNNSGILRSSSHLATVFITNRDDFSNNSPDSALSISLTESCIYNCTGPDYDLYYQTQPGLYVPNITYYNYTPSNPEPGTGRFLIPVSRFRNSVLDMLYPSTHHRAYSFHTYAVVDHSCRNTMDGIIGSKSFIAQRYMDMVTLGGGGILGSACLTAATEIRRLIQGIIAENFKFKLPEYARYVPFEISVGSTPIVESQTDGWSFNPTTLMLQINGNSIPRADQSIHLKFIID